MSQDYEETVSCFKDLARDNNVCLDISKIELRSDIGFDL